MKSITLAVNQYAVAGVSDNGSVWTRMKKNIFIILFIIALLPLHAYAANICVSPSGSGSGNGSDWNNTMSWSSLTLTRGNTYYLRDGTYSSKAPYTTAVSGTSMIVIKKAIASDHVTDIGWVSSMANQAILRPGMDIETSYITFDGQVPNTTVPNSDPNAYGFKMQDASGCSGRWAGIPPTDTVMTVNNITVKNIAFVGCGGCGSSSDEYGIWTRAMNSSTGTNGQVNYLTISNNYFSGFVNSVWLMTTRDATVASNYFNSNVSCSYSHGETMNLAGTLRTTIRNNFFYRPITAAIGNHMWNGINEDVWIYDNIFRGTGDDVNMIIGSENDPDQMHCGVYIYNNDFMGMNVVAYGLIWLDTSPSGCSKTNYLYNNIFYGLTGAGVAFGARANVTRDYNYYANNSSYPGSGAHDINGGSTSPFTSYSGGDYSLLAASSAVDHGTALGSPFNIDYTGAARPYGASWDIGAYEYITGGSGGSGGSQGSVPSPPSGLTVQ